MPRPVQVALDEALATAEGGDRLPNGRLERVRDLLDCPDDLQATPPAAMGRLDRDRHAVLDGEGHNLLDAADRTVRAGHERRPHLPSDGPGLDLVAQHVDHVRWRADPGQSGALHSLRERGVLRQEPVAGVDRVRAGVPGDAEQLADVQVGRAGRLAGQRVRLVGHPDMEGVQVLVGVDGHAGEPGVPACPSHPDRYLTAVGYQDLAHAAAHRGYPQVDGVDHERGDR